MRRVQDIIIVICLFFSAYASLASDALNSIALYVVLPLAFLLSFWKNSDVEINKFVNKYERILLVLIGWIFLSSLWAEYNDAASRESHRCLGSILLSVVFASNATNKKMIPWLYLTYLVLYIGAWNYAQNNILIDVTGAYANDKGRMNDAKLNANTMAYYTFYVSLIVFILGEILESVFWKKISRIAFFLLIPLSFLVALVTASRQVLVIQIPLLSFLLYNRYWHRASLVYRVITVIALIISFWTLSGFVESVYEKSYLAVRNEKNVNDDSRFFLLKEAFVVGIEHFPLGVGAGNFKMYSRHRNFSHNSYLELFANQGVFGASLFIWLIGFFLKKQWQNYKITKDNNYLLFTVFGLFFVVDNFFYVFYLDMWLISFFILVATHSETCSQEHSAYIVCKRKLIKSRSQNDNE